MTWYGHLPMACHAEPGAAKPKAVANFADGLAGREAGHGNGSARRIAADLGNVAELRRSYWLVRHAFASKRTKRMKR